MTPASSKAQTIRMTLAQEKVLNATGPFPGFSTGVHLWKG